MKNLKTIKIFAFCMMFSSCLLYGQSAYSVILSSPSDFDTIIEKEPTLVWQIDLQGITSDPRYSQRLVLCELLENQTKGEALVMNSPLVILNNYLNSTYTYSSSTNELLEGHTYVWQLQILFNSIQVDQSDIFQFTIFEPPLIPEFYYPVVFKNDGQTYSVVDDKIGIVTEEQGTFDLKLTIQKDQEIINDVYLHEMIDGELTSESNSQDNYKKRFFQLILSDLDLDQGTYIVVWKPKKNKIYTFNFVIP